MPEYVNYPRLNLPVYGQTLISTSNNTTSSPSTFADEDASINQIIDKSNQMTISPPKKGFLDLPGELRNQIYTYPTTLPTALALLSTSHQIRQEYTSLHTQHTGFSLSLDLIQSFITTTFPMHTLLTPPSTPSTSTPTPTLQINLSGPDTHHTICSTLDILRLLSFLLAFPTLPFTLQTASPRYDRKAADYTKFFIRARQNRSIWLAALDTFDAIEQDVAILARPMGAWRFDRWYEPSGKLEFVPRTRVREAWGKDKEGYKEYVKGVLADMGLWVEGEKVLAALPMRIRFFRF